MYTAKQMIVMRHDLKMRKGKIAAQAGHACVEAVLLALKKEGRMDDIRETEHCITIEDGGKASTPLSDWFQYGMAKICVYVNSEEELLEIDRRAREMGFISALIQDAGMTEFHGQPTYTCLALEPLTSEQVEPLTGSLPLY